MGRHLDEGPRGSAVQVIFVSEIARSATVLHQPFIEPDDLKWRLAGQGAATVLNCAAQAEIVRAPVLCRVVRGGDDVRQVEKRLIDAELSVAYRFNPPGVSGWNLPPLVIRAFGAHCQNATSRSVHPGPSSGRPPAAAPPIQPCQDGVERRPK